MDIVLAIILIYAIIKLAHYFMNKNKPTHKIEVQFETVRSYKHDDKYIDEHVDDYDSWEGTVYEAEYSFGVSANFKIKYTDSKGAETEREVTVRNAGTINGKKAIFGYCKMRNASRTFIIAQIFECIDLDTGEFVNDIYTYLQNKYENSPEKAIVDFERNEMDTLSILAYVGRADEQFRKAEKEIAFEAISKISGDDRITYDAVDKLLSNYGRNSSRSFKLAVGRAAASKPEPTKAIILDATQRMVATQKQVSPAEKEALDYICKKFKQE